MKIEKKVLPDFFEKILSRDKNFELRLDDFECNPGDTLILREWDPNTQEYTQRVLEKEVTYVLRTRDIDFWSPEEIKKYGFKVISFK